MRITVLIDNEPCSSQPLLAAEHGLSFYIEYDCPSASDPDALTVRVLCDMGASGLFIRNAELLGVDLSALDFAFLSHAHADHTGGLRDFLTSSVRYSEGAGRSAEKGIRIYHSSSLFGPHYYSSRRGARRDISADGSLAEEFADNFISLNESCWISEGIAAVFNDSASYPQPAGNVYLTKDGCEGECADDFSHEMSLAFVTPEGLVVVSSCSHCGALNIIDSCCRFTGVSRVAAFVGGLHFVDPSASLSESDSANHNEAEEFLNAMAILHPETKVFTGHCTGTIARSVLLSGSPTSDGKPSHQDNTINLFATGTVINPA